jgi:predicted porin
MKKLVIAAAVLGAFAGTAQAQSSVTLFGVVDTNVTHLTGGGNPVGSRTFMDNSGINSSRLGFRGTEDLGGGLKAGFWLEAGINTNNGSGGTTSLGNGAAFPGTTATGGGGLTFNRRSTVSLISQQWGEVRVGRDYVPTFWNSANTDPFGYNGISEVASFLIEGQGAEGATAVRASNGMSYLTPNTLGGFFGQVTYAIGGNPSTYTVDGVDESNDGDYYGVNLGYQNGPLYVGVATSYLSMHSTGTPLVEGTLGGTHVVNGAISYDFGFIKPDFFYSNSTVAAQPEPLTTKVYSVGAVVPLGQGEFRANYVHTTGSDYFSGSHANMFGVGYVYNLSKRTALYALAARVNNSGKYAFSLNNYSPAPEPGENQSGVSLGIRTSF